jgi:hypothetical protein
MSLNNIPVEQFGGLITAQKHGIARATEKCRDNMDKELRCVWNQSLISEQSLTKCRIIRHLTDHDSDDGYFAQAMRPTYREAAQVRGKISRVMIYMPIMLTRIRHRLQEQRNDNAGRPSQQQNS